MPGTLPMLSERFTFCRSSRISSPYTRSIDAGTSSTGVGARVAVTTTASSAASAGPQSATAASPPSVRLISARLPAMRALVSFLLLGFIGLAGAQPDASLISQLRQGGYVLYLRH